VRGRVGAAATDEEPEPDEPVEAGRSRMERDLCSGHAKMLVEIPT
jgi:hypothetical protein